MAIKAANDKSMSNITALPSGVSAKSMILLSTQTASSSATIDFTSGIDSTYKEYIFKFIGIHPQTDATVFQMNGSTDTGSNYNVTKTTTAFYAIHRESETTPVLEYDTGSDLAQSTAFSRVVSAGNTGNDNDQCCVGQMWLFNPSSTTFVKHFMAVGDTVGNSDYDMPGYIAGYFNTTSAIDAIQFKMNSGNIDSGTIKMYGVV
tara:strand:- start:78 stop:689 length:612 start_codon:yes stop_codon:yes gene_type:complete